MKQKRCDLRKWTDVKTHPFSFWVIEGIEGIPESHSVGIILVVLGKGLKGSIVS